MNIATENKTWSDAMKTVDIKTGEKLRIVWSGLTDTPFGKQSVEAHIDLSYDELIEILTKDTHKPEEAAVVVDKEIPANGEEPIVLSRGIKHRVMRSPKYTTPGLKFSRYVFLAIRAIRTGKWPSGSEHDANEVMADLHNSFSNLSVTEYGNITENALRTLSKEGNSKKLNTNSQVMVREILEKVQKSKTRSKK